MYSEVGYGTSVCFYLPLPETAATAVPLEASSAAPRLPESCTVLLVDDEEDLLEIASAYVLELGCQPLVARDGNEALAILRGSASIDAMITDIVMPGGLSGGELAEEARRLRPEMKIIFCSGFPADALAERPFGLRDGPLLRKPYHGAEIHAMIRQALAQEEPA